jgi:hypothetical protein
MVKILEIFKAQLRDEDSYIYLAAIQGLEALSDIFPEQTIPVLCRNFQEISFPLETRIKIGESIVNIVRRCGTAVSKWGSFNLKKNV